MKKILMIGLTVAALSLSACGNHKHFHEEHAKYDRSLSKAMNLALITGLTKPEGPLRDSEPVHEATKKNANGSNPIKAVTTVSSVAVLAAQSTGVLLDSGMGIGGSMGMGVMGLLIGSRQVVQYQPVLSTTIFSWMPVSLAKNKVDAATLMFNVLHDKTKQALKKMGAKITLLDVTEPTWFDSSHYESFEYMLNNRYYVSYINVQKPQVIDSYFFKSTSDKYYYWNYKMNSDDNTPVIGFSTTRLNDKHHWINKDSKDHTMEVELFTSVMKSLPSYCYTYISPVLKAKKDPYFINNGKELRFIKPTL